MGSRKDTFIVNEMWACSNHDSRDLEDKVKIEIKERVANSIVTHKRQKKMASGEHGWP